MALDGSLLSRALARLEVRRSRRELEEQELRQKLYRLDPVLSELDSRIQRTAAQAIEVALKAGEDPVLAMEKLEERSLELQRKRAERIAALGYPEHCIDGLPACGRCGDRGFVGTRPCDCLLELYQEEQRQELSKLLDLQGERFSAFRLDYYDDRPDPNTGVSPRQQMNMVELACRRYAETFSDNGANLFLSGGPGLGKTFLSACIASVVSQRGFSVVYETAINLCACYEAGRFNRGDAEENAREKQRYHQCDLLILDDLGTETHNAYNVSAIYDIVNSRLRSGRSTVISSNYSPEELSDRYSPQIASRLTGEYTDLRFYGQDIRRLKNEM